MLCHVEPEAVSNSSPLSPVICALGQVIVPDIVAGIVHQKRAATAATHCNQAADFLAHQSVKRVVTVRVPVFIVLDSLLSFSIGESFIRKALFRTGSREARRRNQPLWHGERPTRGEETLIPLLVGGSLCRRGRRDISPSIGFEVRKRQPPREPARHATFNGARLRHDTPCDSRASFGCAAGFQCRF